MNLREYDGTLYPEYMWQKNAAQFVMPFAQKFCEGKGYDIGGARGCFPGAEAIDLRFGTDGTNLPPGQVDFIFSSHCLEHLQRPLEALKHWHSRIRDGGTLFLYLPHPAAKMWAVGVNPGHVNMWEPMTAANLVRQAGFQTVIHSTGHDLMWSFSVVGFK